jgi:DNA modification methylase
MTVTLYHGNCLEILRQWAEKSVHCVVTSPPYWSLRDYDLPPIEWPTVTYRPMPGMAEVTVQGCEDGCGHAWGETQEIQVGATLGGDKSTLTNWAGSTEAAKEYAKKVQSTVSKGQFCHLCHGWRGSLGLEPTPTMYVAHLVAVFRENWRVLRDDGSLWLNLGDSYASQGGYRDYGSHDNGTGRAYNSGLRANGAGLKTKDLCGIPWRVALALLLPHLQRLLYARERAR